MNPIVKNILAVIAGLVLGGLVNAGIVALGSSILPTPEGVDPNDIESIRANAHLYSWKHFINPFLAHAIGTLVGAFVVAKIAVSSHKKLSYLIGLIFMIGGIMMAVMIPELKYFSMVDILLAYFPFAWLGWSLAGKPNNQVA